ncbi:MAG TPA: sigma-54 dependent transcriptional regulator [Opitutaceae bacterium]|jgi:NtrC-family two-component system response regulator AlgB|nr:sigma-54 dependent transcriptional regulator [Opitutaceae bacterium]
MRVLIVDDEAAIRKTTRIAVEMAGHTAVEAAEASRALKALEEEPFDAVFLDLRLGSEDGMDLLGRILKPRPGLPVILFTAYANVATAVEAMRRGAFDFIPKPFTPDQIRTTLAKVQKSRELEARVMSLETELAGTVPPLRFDSADPAVQRALDIAFKAAPTPATILLLGPSGTGKSALARELHRRGPQAGGPFVTVSCPSLSKELLESELFGHAKGSFTGAVSDAAGKVAAAEGGTLFLDEIGELPMEIQPKLLRLLQERDYERVGENRTRHANVRVIAATNRNLAGEVQAGRFREDLFYRLNVISVTLPGLKDRPEDLSRMAGELLRFFAGRMGKKVSAFSAAAEAALAGYAWPGNLRELSNVIERAVILSTGPFVDLNDLPEELRTGERPAVNVGMRVSLQDLEEEHIRRILASARNLDEAARILAIDPATLYRKRQRMGLLHSQPHGLASPAR